MSNLFNLVKVSELPPVWERAEYSLGLLSAILLFVKICLSIFPSDAKDKL